MFLYFKLPVWRKFTLKSVVNPVQKYIFLKCIGTHNVSSVGFIGLGVMGSRMARNLLKQFKNVYVHDVNAEAVDILVKQGALAINQKELKDLDCIITMLPASQHVLQVYQGPNGLISKVRPNTLLIDCSTADPEVPQTLAVEAKKHSVTFLDAPVSGGQMAAEAGTLTFMVGGTEADVKRSQHVLSAMGKNIIHCGATGCGQIAKMCNNMLLAISMIGTSEAMNLGIRLGMDPKVLANVINVSTGRCWSSDTYNPVPGVISGVPASNNYKGGFAVRLIAKDLGIVKTIAERSETFIPLGTEALTTFKILNDKGKADLDFSVVYKYIKEMKTTCT